MPRDCVNGDPDVLKAKGVKMRPWFAINIWLTLELAKTLPVMSKLDVYDQVGAYILGINATSIDFHKPDSAFSY